MHQLEQQISSGVYPLEKIAPTLQVFPEHNIVVAFELKELLI